MIPPLARVPPDELVRDVVEIIADQLRLRADTEQIVAAALDQRGAPAGGEGAERVPGVTGDQEELRGWKAELLLEIGVGLTRRLVVLDAVGADSPLEQIGDAAMLHLPRLDLEQIVGEREQAEA